MFPSLVNCCTIDWFREWPMEALKSVASSFFTDVELESDSNPQLLQVRGGGGEAGLGGTWGVAHSNKIVSQTWPELVCNLLVLTL